MLEEQIKETITHLIGQREALTDAENDVAVQEEEIENLQEQLRDERAELASLKERVKSEKTRLIGLVDELGRLNRGEPRLPMGYDPETKAPSTDPADHHQLSELTNFGLSDAELEKLTESQLVQTHGIKTVGDLLRAISDDEWWHKKIKGYGDVKINKLTGEVLVDYRAKNPIPDSDDRLKRCRAEECGTEYDPSLNQCPSCGSPLFELVDEVGDLIDDEANETESFDNAEVAEESEELATA